MFLTSISTDPELLQRGDGLGGVAGEQVVQQAQRGQGVVDAVEDSGLQLLDHVPLQVQGGDGGEVAELAAAQVPDAVLGQVEEGEAGQVGQGPRHCLQLTALQVQVLQGLLETVEGAVGQGDGVVGELEGVEAQCDEGVVGDVLDLVAGEVEAAEEPEGAQGVDGHLVELVVCQVEALQRVLQAAEGVGGDLGELGVGDLQVGDLQATEGVWLELDHGGVVDVYLEDRSR